MLRNPNQSRVPLVEPPYDAALTALGPPISLFRAFAHRPDRARGIQGWGSYYLSRRCALSLRHRELVIDRTTALCGAEYEWGIHIALFAAKAALTGDQVRSLTAGSPADACWTDPGDRAVLAAVDALHARNDLTDEEWAAVTEAVGADGAVDLMLICGWYHAISYVARAARLTPEPGSPTFEAISRQPGGAALPG
ncbi:carboxymuconolactone decarboxylase family protein [Actinoplanes sp. NPDC026619]|uniref:carboxymuconolactone decarboxylase family protein n=1 Tax=Actinoplanes sp. NPDC026619 TaxID=3155798 RepID=UPI0033E23C26